MKHKTARLQSVISLVFSFLLTVLFIAILFATGLYFGAFSDKMIKLKVTESNYYNEAYAILYNKAEEIVEDAGLPVEVLEGAVTLERVYIGGKYYVEDVLAGKQPTYKTENLSTDLEANINSYLYEHKVEVTEELKAGTEELVTRILQEYQRGIQFDFIHSISKMRQIYMRIIMIAMPIVLLLATVIIVTLIRMYPYKHRGIRYINLSVITASAMTGITALFILLLQSYKVTVEPSYYMVFLNSYFKWNVQIYLGMAGFGVIISVLLFMLMKQLKENIR